MNNISQIYRALGDDASALRYLKKALAIQQEIGNKAGEGMALNNLSAIYALGDDVSALSSLKDALSIAKAIGDKAGEGIALNNLSKIYHARGDDASALRYLEEASAIQKEIVDRAGLCVSLFNMGHLYWEKSEEQEAFLHWISAYRIAIDIGEAQILSDLEQLAVQLGLEEGLAFWEAASAKWEEQNGTGNA